MQHSDVAESHDTAEKNMQTFSMDIGRLEEAQKLYNKLQLENEKILENLAQAFQDSSPLLFGKSLQVFDIDFK